MSRIVRAAAITAVVVLVLYAALLAAIYFESDKLVFPGAGAAVQPVNPAATFPGAEDVKIPVDGATFAHAWWIPSQSGTQQTLLCFHGNGYALEDELTREAPALYQTGTNLLLVDYRGYGTSSKLATSPETTAADARAAFHYLTDQRHIAPSNIWIFGRSIGASIAVRLATETPNAGGVILLTPITNTADVEPYRKLVKPLGWLGLTKVWNSLARMPQIHIPVTIIAGSLDTLAPPWMAHALYEAANNPKSLKMIDGADHNDILAADRDRMVNWEIKRAMLPPDKRASEQSGSTPAAEVVKKYLSLVAKGDLLTFEGWTRASALFITAMPYPEHSDILLMTADFSVSDFENNGHVARVGGKWGDAFGYLGDDLKLHPYRETLESVLTEFDYQLELTNRHVELDANGRVKSETIGPWEWKILGPFNYRETTRERAIGYVQHIRDTTKDPEQRKAAEKAILQMKKMSVNCAC